LLPVIGVGNAKVKGANGELVGLGNVLLVKGLSANLLSVRRLQKSKAEVTFGPTSCRAKLGKKVLWSLEEETSCIKDLWQLPIIPWNGKTPTAATAAAAKATAGGDATAPTDGVLEAVKKVQQQQRHGEVLAGVDASAAWAKASSKSGEADWETWHERLCHVNFPMLQKLVKDGSLKGLEVKGGVKEIGSCPTCLETKFSKFPFNSTTGPAKTPLALVHMDVVGPTRAPSLSGSRYFLTIVDDHTRAADELQQPSRQVEVAVSEEEMSGVTEEGGAAEVEQQQQQHDKKQNEVGLSSCETEYMALHHGAKEVVWLRRLLEELGVGQEEPTVVFCDNESAVKLAKNACLHGLTKHIRPKWHWVRRLLDKEVRLEIVKTHQQAADIFTKRLAEADHWKGMKLAGMSVH
ncbi:hypothetical protein CLOP_g22652, partial [Closterium sp. NIES-67]